MENNNATRVLTKFIGELHIPVTRKTVCDELEKHPDYNSLFAFSDLMTGWRIPNAAYQLKFDQLTDVPTPFIAHLSNKEFGVVSRFDENEAVISNERWNNKVFPVNEFKKIYSGSVLVAEKETNSGESDYAEKHWAELINDLRLPAVFTGSVFILLMFLVLHSSYISTFSWQVALLTLFKTTGLITAILLLTQSIDANNPLVQKLCGGDNNKDCNAILSSKDAKIVGISWSEIGFFYFAGTWLVFMLNTGHVAIMQALAVLNLVSLPYTFYSIYYQWRVAKQWCVFCCTVQAVLWLEFFAFLPWLIHGFETLNLSEWSNILMGLAAPVLGWMLVKPYLLQAKQMAPLKQQLRQFKYNTELFKKMLSDEVKYTLPDEENSLIIGNREAENIITMVSNPYCQPCAKAHKALDEWMTGRDDVKLQVVFSTQNNEKDKKTEVAAHLMTLQANRDDISLKKALNDWYEQKQKNYDAWAKLYPKTADWNATKTLEKQKEWCQLTEIKGTPTLFLNGRRLPKNYQPEDLKYFI